MAKYDVAHIREQGIDLIIVPLRSSFGSRTPAQQNDTARYLQSCATAARLAGTVVPVWESGDGRLASLAPSNYHPFFRSINMDFVRANINGYLECN